MDNMVGIKRRIVKGLKKLGDFAVSKGHGYPLVYKIITDCCSLTL